jgi:general secretion pathway protein J
MTRRAPDATSRPRAQRGFTLIELLIALTLMALLSAVLFGSLRMAGKSADSGDARAEASAGMRLASQFLHTQLEEQHPQRMKKMPDFPLLFTGTTDELDYAAALPARVQGGGVWYYRLHVAQNGDQSLLVLDRLIPDVTATTLPVFGVADQGQSILAEGVQAIKVQYYGRDAGADVSQDPTWRTSWDDRQNLPLAIRIDVTTTRGTAWPPIFASPRTAPESGCKTYDSTRMRCVNA